MTIKINADTTDGLKFVSDTSGVVDIQSNGTTKMTVGTTIDVQGNELVLDADADTSIHADTDDQIDIKVGGTDSISITPSQITITDADSNQPRLLLKNTNADATPAFLDFQKDSSSPADDDVIGKMRFIGDDDGGNTVAYATIVSTSPDVSDGSEDGDLRFETTVDGTNAERMRIDRNGRVGIGTDSPTSPLTVSTSTGATGVRIVNTSSGSLGADLTLQHNSASPADNDIISFIAFQANDSTGTNTVYGQIRCIATDVTDTAEDGRISFLTTNNGTLQTRMSLDTLGRFGVGSSTTASLQGANGTTTQFYWQGNYGVFASYNDLSLILNRQGNDGTLLQLRQAGSNEGSISVSGSTVSYNGGHLSRWGRLSDGSQPTILKGTVMSNLDEMVVWSYNDVLYTEEDELPVDDDGNPTASVGDVKIPAYTAENEQRNQIKVSDVEGDINVAGLFVKWDTEEDGYNDIDLAMTGDMIIRIAQGTTVQRGDLLMSAGDGTAKPQGDDIVRSKTIAKVTSTTVINTYDDGSYVVPCVVMAC